MSNVLAFRTRVEAKPAIRGFALLHRKITQLPFYKTDSQAVHLWTHIILMANYQPSVAVTEYGEIMLKRGQFITGRNTLASETGIEPNRVQYLLRKFKKLGMIETQSPGKFTIITVAKYEEYQGDFRGENTPKSVPEDYQTITRPSPELARSVGKGVPDNYQTITTDKQYNNNKKIPLTPTGGMADAQEALRYYNKLANGSCRDAKPFETLLTATASRSAYTLDDLKTVIRWAITTWPRKGRAGAPKPMNLCRVTRFDGYLSDATQWAATAVDIDCAAVVEAYNEICGSRMPPASLTPEREIAIRATAPRLKNKTLNGFRAYFSAFVADARDFYFGGAGGTGWRADFDFVIRPSTLTKLREGTL